MSFLKRVPTLLASILVILMVFGCGAPAGSAGSASPEAAPGGSSQAVAPESRESNSSAANAEPGRPSRVTSVEPTEPLLAGADPESEPGQGGESASADSADPGFGGARELDDPFALIGPAFSGLGFQSYSSGCDPFEDKYGTCL